MSTCKTRAEVECTEQLLPAANILAATVTNRLVGLVAKASASRPEDPGFESRSQPGSSHTSGSTIDTSVATLPGAWRYRVSVGTGRPGVIIL